MSVRDPRAIIAGLSPEQREILRARLQKTGGTATAGGESPDAIPRRARPAEGLPLSFAQQRLWFIDQLIPGNPAYNMPASVRLSGPLDPAALAGTLAAIARRHEALRTSFRSAEGTPVQVIAAEPAIPLPLVDLGGLPPAAAARETRSLAAAAAYRPFRLDTGPLLRALLLRWNDREHVLLLIIHHVISDGWSIGVLQREIAAIYEALSAGLAPELPELPIQYADFALWQRGQLQGEILESQLSYWRRRLESPPRLRLPADRPRPAGALVRGAARIAVLPRLLQARLDEWAREEGATPFMVLLAAFGVLLSRYSGQSDLVVGSPIANRRRRETEGLIGFFVNTLALRLDLAGDPSARQLLRRVRKTALEAYAHQDVPFERLVEAVLDDRHAGENPLFQVLFALQSTPAGATEVRGLRIEPLPIESRTTQFDLVWSLFESPGGLAVAVLYSTDLYDGPTIGRMLGHFETLLRAAVDDPRARVSDLAMLTAAERHQVLGEWADSWEPGADRLCLHELFAAQAERTPAAVAVSLDGVELTYEELNRRANRLAHRLIELGVGDGTFVALFTGRTLEMVAAILGILKAGGAYVPLDPAYPRERLAWILEDTRAPVVLTETELLAELPPVGDARLVCLDRSAGMGAGEPAGDPPRRAGAASPAYVIYTSGSTGRPKGVVVLHANAIALFEATWEDFRFGPGDVGTLFHSQAFDFSVWELWAMLLYGGRLVVVPYWVSRSPEEFRRLLARERVTVLNQTPSAFRQLAEADARNGEEGGLELRVVVFGGEALDLASLRPWFEKHGDRRPRLINMYGITETTVHVTYRPLSLDDLAQPARGVIGRAIPDLRIHLLDHRLQPVPIGVPGEIFVGGRGVARGYLRRPALTAERFVPDFGSRGVGARLYRSGDTARFLPSGELEFLGRIDQQVKVRGFRIELGEIEAVLSEHPGVREALVTAREDGAGGTRLVAYVVLDPAAAVATAELRRALLARLPEYMVPSVFISLSGLPLTAHGKVDRSRLPVPEGPEEQADGGTPRTPVEEIVAAIWCDVLRVPQVSRSANFFELGGHSLLATQVVSRLRSATGVDIALRELFQAPTVEALAAALEAALSAGASIAAAPPIEPVPRQGSLPLSFAQERLWFLDRLAPGNAAYNIPLALVGHGELSLPAMAAAIGEIVRRHEALRTTYVAVDDRPAQVIAPAEDWTLPLLDLSALPEVSGREEARRLADETMAAPFILERDPVLRVRAVRIGRTEHVLLLVIHHIAADGWSVGVLVEEIAALYPAALAGVAVGPGGRSVLPELAVQYADFAVWQRQWLQGEVLERQLAYWRETLATVSALDLPTDRPRPPLQSFRGGTRIRAIGPEVNRALSSLARQHDATLFMVLLAAVEALLGRYTGQEDVTLGSPIANRNRAEIEPLIGFFVNSLVFRGDLRGDPPFRELLARTRRAALGAYSHQDLPFERLVEELRPERRLSHNPLFQVVCALQNAPLRAIDLPGLTFSPVDFEFPTTRFDLEVIFNETEEGLSLRFTWSSDLFDTSTVLRWAGHLDAWLAGLLADPSRRLSEIPLLGETERHELLVEWNDAAASPGGDVVELFAARVAAAPQALAVAAAGTSLSYRELAVRALSLARELRGLGVGPEVCVGLHTDRSPELVLGALAVLLAGGAYVPLDPSYPAERLAYMVRESGMPALLSRTLEAGALPSWAVGARVIRLSTATPLPEGEPKPWAAPPPETLAYVIYTSGSTGRPKGVQVSRGGLLSLVRWHLRAWDVAACDRATLVASSGFDASVWEIWPYLAAGASLHVPDEETRLLPDRLLSWLATSGITLTFLPTPLAERVLERAERELPPGLALRALLTGGDRLQRAPSRPLPFRLGNHYGPTESSVVTTWTIVAPVSEEEAVHPPSIGRPVDGTRVYALDPHLRLAPSGIPGELAVGGAGLARGYLGRPDLTAERFLPDPFSGRPGERMYRTGDLVRHLAVGELEFRGRLDHQVKVRGFRIELGEIESVIDRHPRVREVVVVARDDGTTGRRLVAYVVPHPDGEAEPAGQIAQQHIANWRDLYEETYGKTSDVDEAGDPTFNLQGWNSSYTGEPIPAVEMGEWVETTVDRLLALPHRRVLEVGCGTGLLLFRVAPRAERYRGTDFSAVALGYVRRQVEKPGSGLAHVELDRRMADDWNGVVPGGFDLVVLNSVVQYFPDVDYLVRVLEGAVQAVAPDGVIFVGDVRSLPLLQAFHTAVELHLAPPSRPVAEIRSRVQRRLEDEEELVIDPAFFGALARHLPGVRAEVMLKRGRAHNELTCFRYDAVLHLDGGAARALPEPLDWQSAELSLAALERRLAADMPAVLTLAGIPSARLARETVLVALLADPAWQERTAEELRREIAPGSLGSADVEPEDLWQLAEGLGYAATVTWSARGGADGRFDAVLRRRTGPRTTLMSMPGVSIGDRPWRDYANTPLNGNQARRMVPELRRFLESELPDYMVPSAIVLLDVLPLTPSGKIDRAALPAPERGREPAEAWLAPATPLETLLTQVAAKLLGIEQVGMRDNFFDLGGHSLLATQLVSRLNQEHGIRVTLRMVFDSATLADLADHIVQKELESTDGELLDARLRKVERLVQGPASGEAREVAPGGRGPASHPLPIEERLAELSREQRALLFEQIREELAEAQPEPIPRRPPSLDLVPLSFAQERLWFLGQLDPEAVNYNMPLFLGLRGSLSRPALAASLSALAARHEVLRTTFTAVNRQTVQRIAPTLPVSLPLIDLRGLSPAARSREAGRLATAEAALPFDLSLGPLLRTTLLRLEDEQHIALFTVHHIIADAWSLGILVREVGALYSALSEERDPELPELPIQYADYAVWQRQWLSGERLESELKHWRRRLAGAPPVLELPTDRPRPARPSLRGGSRPIELSAELSQALVAVGRSQDATLFMTLLATFQILLSRYSGQTDVPVGTPVAGRGRVEVEGLVGFFVNTLVIRTRLAESSTLAQVLRQVRDDVLTDFAHQDLPFERLVEELQPERDPHHTPLFQVAFALQNAAIPPLELRGLSLAPVLLDEDVAKFDLIMSLSQEGDRIVGGLGYSADLFDGATVVRWLRHYSNLLVALAERPGDRWSDLSLLSPPEQHQIAAEWNDKRTAYPADRSLAALFEARAAEIPDVVALSFFGESLSFGELNAAANRLAWHLRELGVGAETPVAVCLDRSLEMAVVLLAIVKAGGYYVPLDPTYPADRLRWMLGDSQAIALLSRGGLATELAGCGTWIVDLEEERERIAMRPVGNLAAGMGADGLAYVMYTSGSTGQPKGVAIPQRGVIRLLLATDYVQLGPGDRIAQISNSSFDAATFEIWGALLCGACLVGIRKETALSSRELAAELRHQGITVLFLTTALFQQIAHESPGAFADIRTLLVGGQEMDAVAARAVLAAVPPERLLNVYGPTESTTFATTHPIKDLAPEVTSIPIGRPIANTHLYVLDRGLGPVPMGASGRLHIGGDGLGRGYWRRPELTAERFVPDPFGEPGARLYDSGDLARFLPDGRIMFLGRTDHQVKIRGFRIELGEIEAILASHPEIASAVVLALQSGTGDRQLAAYVVPRAGGGPEAGLRASLREHLRGRLPEYMLPSALVVLPALPLTPNGKVDRGALPTPGIASRTSQEGFVVPQTFIEQVLAETWSELLSVEPVGRHDDFFELGGHSLLATQAVSRARRSFRIEIPLQSLFRNPVLADFAREIETLQGRGSGAGELPSIPPADRGGELPLSFAQQRLWFMEQLDPGGSAYNVPMALRCRRPLDPDALSWAVSRIVERHEVLRTRFETLDGRPAQCVEPPVPIGVPVIDLGGLPAGDCVDAARRLARGEAARPFDLRQGYLLRLSVLRLAADDQILVLTLHHIASDGWSSSVLLREMEELYTARVEGRTPDLPELPIQYADFAAWQRRWLSGEVMADHLAYARRRFGGELPRLDLPADAPPSDRPDHRGGSAARSLPASLIGPLRALGREQGCTLAMTLLAGFEILLHRLSGQSELIVGLVIANRNHFEIEGLIGFFVNTLALRMDLGGDPSFRTLLDRVREVTLDGYTHQDLPFERLVEEVQPERSLGRNPLFEVLFNHLAVSGEDRVASARLALEPWDLEEPEAKFPLTLYLSELAEGVSLRLVYQRARFSGERVGRMLDQLEHLLDQLIAGPDLPIGVHSLATPAARLGLPDPATPLPESPFRPVAEIVLGRAARAPERPAVRRGESVWSYGELAARADETARALVAAGLERGEVVAVSGERGFGLIVSLLAVLGSGGVLLTLDGGLPAARRRLMLRTASARRLLHSGPLPAGDEWLAEECPDRLVVDAATGRLTGAATGADPLPPLPLIEGDDPAYVFFTSGTTGVPKGVVGVHKGLSHFLDWQRQAFGIGEDDRGALLITLSFDAVLRDLFLPLTSGACLHLPAADMGPGEVVRWLDREGITYLHAVPTVAQAWLSERPAGSSLARLRWIFLSGEPLTDALVARWREAFPAAGEVVNFYGATEATMIQSFFRVPTPALPGVQPAGRPLPDCQLLVLSETGRLCGFGEPGEVFVRTPFRTRGYLNAPEDQARGFISNPFRTDPGDLLYRTGDRGRYRPDGALEVLGRLDHQVKIRGVRVEPEEVAANLLRHPVVKAAVVVPWGGEPSLAAYVVAGNDDARPDLRAFLAERLPPALIPASFTWLERLPLTPTGKVDRRALPPPEVRSEAVSSLPRTLTEDLLATLWSEVLGVGQPGPEDDFFELGGHSLLATQVMSRVSRVFGVELPLRTLFEASRLRGLAARIDGARSGGRSPELPPLERALHRGPLPLSFGQQRLWFFERLEAGRSVYNVPLRLRMRGRVEVAALVATLSGVVRRHEVLRTRFVSVEGRAAPVVEPPTPLPLPIVDLSILPQWTRLCEGERLAGEETARPFDLGRAPLLRVLLLRFGVEEHEAVLTMHHIASDGWSLGVLVREVGALYGRWIRGESAPLPELPIQYGDFARWQRQWLQGEILESQLAYWRGRLAGAPGSLELPADRPRPSVQSFHGARQSFTLPAELSAGLARLGRSHGATLFMTLLAGFEVLLSRVTGQSDLSVGTPVAGRTRLEMEDLIGFFVNTLVLRTDLAEAGCFTELLAKVREVSLEAHAHQEVPFERLVEELRPGRDLGRTPLFQVMFSLQNTPLGELSLPGLELETVAVAVETAKFDLELTFGETAAGLQGWWTYSTDLFDPATIARLAAHLERLLSGIVMAPESPLDSLPSLAEAERHQLWLEWNDNALTGAGDVSVVELLERQAARRPQAPALVCGAEALSFGELNGRANALARRLRSLGAGPESRVGLCAERSPELVIGLLGILKAGGAYVPLDPSYPETRLRFLVEDSEVRWVVTGVEPVAALPGLGVEVVAVEPGTAADLVEKPRPEDLAYLIYTSGTTGAPKAVMVEHGSLANLLGAGAQRFGWTAQDRMPCVAPFTFDIFLFELLSPLLAGGISELVSLRPVLDPERLMASVAASTRLHAVPTLLRQVVERARPEPARYERLRRIFVGGDAVPAELLRDVAQVFPGAEVHVLYGPTEGTVLCSSYEVPANSWRPLLGRPLANMSLSVRDALGGLVLVGVAGELWIGGRGVSRGYLGRPELTAEKYVPSAAGRQYRTGDRARVLADGTLEFLGRVDEQVKVRGFRIEPGEVESALAAQPGVEQAVVVARADGGGGEKRLVAYLVGEAVDVAAVRTALRTTLPDYMVPAVFVVVPSLPLTAHGKVDRAALPSPEGESVAAGGGWVAPRTEPERVLARIWSEVLGVPEVGVHDNFFDLGGDSILTIQILARAERAGLHLTPRQMFEHQTVAALAAVALARSALAAEQGLVAGPAPLTPVQRSFLEMDLEPKSRFVQALLFEAAEPLSPSAVESAMALLVRHHDALRLRFARDGGAWTQRHVEPAEATALVTRIDLSALPAEARRPFVEAVTARLPEGFDLTAGPLAAAVVVHLGDGEADRLLLAIHHLLVDGVSWRVLLEDFELACRAAAAGRPVTLPVKTTSFQTWAERLAEQARGAAREELPFWRLADAPTALPQDTPEGENDWASARQVRVALPAAETEALLRRVPAAYRTRINDVLLAALA
ncbi:MAG TPA: non-ribosomal peptide synthase/polyketide synthase, partial [Thermoanaerobaculia bacterium]|nr:non-ribosomal peptide synthase/polyketide synthase [Thermoanaerobaculia bacterium]